MEMEILKKMNDDYGNISSLRLTYESLPLLKATGVFKHVIDITQAGGLIRHSRYDGNDKLISSNEYAVDFISGLSFVREINDLISLDQWKATYGPPYDSILIGKGAKWRILLRFTNHKTLKIYGALEPEKPFMKDDLPPNAEKIARTVLCLADYVYPPVVLNERILLEPLEKGKAQIASITDNEECRHAQIMELTLLLMYLTSWEEGPQGLRGAKKLPPEEYARFVSRCCWKGYDFDVLNELTELGLVQADGKSKMAVMLDAGTKKAKELMEKYRITE